MPHYWIIDVDAEVVYWKLLHAKTVWKIIFLDIIRILELLKLSKNESFRDHPTNKLSSKRVVYDSTGTTEVVKGRIWLWVEALAVNDRD